MRLDLETHETERGLRHPPEAAGAPSALEAPAARSRRWLALAALALISFLLLLQDTAVSVALPEIRRDLGLGLSGLEWVVNAYTLSIATLLLPAGQLADRYGRKRIFMIGVLVFSAASLFAGLADSASMLLTARVIQGVGAAFTSAAGLSIISTLFAESERGTALGVWAGASAVGLGLGPLAGALLSEAMGWGAVFLVNVPLGLAASVIARRLVPESRGSIARVSVASSVTWGAALFLFVLAVTEAPAKGWLSGSITALFAGSAIWFALFLRTESRSRAPLLDLTLFRNRSFVGANLVTLLSTAVMCNLFFFLSLYFQIVLGYTALGAGAALMPLTATIVIAAPVAGRLSDLRGRRAPVVLGMAMLGVALLLLSRLDLDSALASTLPWLALAGVGIGLTTTPTTAAALDEVPPAGAGVAAGVVSTFRLVGLAIGVATMAAVLSDGTTDVLTGSHHGSREFVAGLSDALVLNAAIAVLAAVVAAATISSAANTGYPTGRRRGSHGDPERRDAGRDP